MVDVTATIAAALGVLSGAGANEIAKKGVADAYDKLKALIQKRFGRDSDPVKIVEDLENMAPDRPMAVDGLQKLRQFDLDKDSDIVEQARLLDVAVSDPGTYQTLVYNTVHITHSSVGAGMVLGKQTINNAKPD